MWRVPAPCAKSAAAACLLAALVLLLPALPASAQREEPLPSELEGVGIDEHLGAQLPLDLPFMDENGRAVKIGDYIGGGKPVILNLVYFECPMLCTVVLNGMVNGLKPLDYLPGREFELVTVSFNPLETPALAKLKQESYIKDYGKPEAVAGWHFLTGSADSIKALTDAVGFHYKWNKERQQYAHEAAIYLVTPDGKLSRYLYGVQFEPQTLKLGLLEASQGKLGSTIDRVVLYCFHYDALSGRYAPAAMNIMRLGGVLTVIILALVLVPVWLQGRRRHKQAATGASH
jgi:protein SCO1/2